MKKPISILHLFFFKHSSIHPPTLYVSLRPDHCRKILFVKGNTKKGTYVTLLKVLMMTKHKVTRRTILAGTTSVGIRKLTHDMTTNIAVGRYTLSKYGVTYLESRISKPYTEQLPVKMTNQINWNPFYTFSYLMFVSAP